METILGNNASNKKLRFIAANNEENLISSWINDFYYKTQG